MTQDISDEIKRATNKVQALLQQLMAHRGEPESISALKNFANEIMTELFELTVKAQKAGIETDTLEEAKETLRRHFPEMLDKDKSEKWQTH